MTNEKAIDFLNRHGMLPEQIDPDVYIYRMLTEMKSGLAGQACSMDMIPTYLSNDGELQPDMQAAVIDAGGTNFRSALVRFQPTGCTVTDMIKRHMPGTDAPCTWEEFISFTADAIEPLMDRADAIGFCFSYAATITPERDGRVITIDKEVVVNGCEGQLVGASLLQELERRGGRRQRMRGAACRRVPACGAGAARHYRQAHRHPQRHGGRAARHGGGP